MLRTLFVSGIFHAAGRLRGSASCRRECPQLDSFVAECRSAARAPTAPSSSLRATASELLADVNIHTHRTPTLSQLQYRSNTLCQHRVC